MLPRALSGDPEPTRIWFELKTNNEWHGRTRTDYNLCFFGWTDDQGFSLHSNWFL